MPKNHKPYGLSGEPWHVEYLRTESDDDRRDKRRCLYYEKGNYCGKKGERCIGSSHCSQYKEKEPRPQASRYLQEDGRYYQVKEPTFSNRKSAAIVGGNYKDYDDVIPYKDFADPKVKTSTFKIVRYKTGTGVESKNLGTGVIISAEDGHYIVRFKAKTSTFMMDAFDQGYLKAIGDEKKEIRYQAVVEHPFLPAFHVVEGDTEATVQQAAGQIKSCWENEWNTRIDGLKDKLHTTKNCVDAANLQTVYAARVRNRLETFSEANDPPRLIDFEDNGHRKTFPMPEPDYPQYYPIPREPMIEDYGKPRKMGFFQRLFKLQPVKISRVNKDQYESDHLVWERKKQKAEEGNNLLYQEYAARLSQWEQARDEFYAAEQERIRSAKAWHIAIRRGEISAIKRYFEEIVNQIDIPLCFEKKFTVMYDDQTKRVEIDFCLPNPKSVPRARRTIYQEKSDSFKEEHYSYEETRKLRERVNEQIIMAITNSIKAGARAEGVEVKSVSVKGYTERFDEKMRQVIRRYWDGNL